MALRGKKAGAGVVGWVVSVGRRSLFVGALVADWLTRMWVESDEVIGGDCSG